MANVENVPIAEVRDDVYQSRASMDPDRVNELVASIGRIGLINPLICVRDGEALNVVAGHSRLAAVRKLDWQMVPVIVREDDPDISCEVAIADNLFRQDLTPIEVACAITDLLDGGVMDVTQIAAAMHRSEHWVQRQMDITHWPADVQAAVHSRKLSVAAAANLAVVTDNEYREFLVRNALESGATARTTAAWLQAWRSMLPREESVAAEPGPAGTSPAPAIAQAPCFCCAQLHRPDGMAYVAVCPECVSAIRGAATAR